MKAKDFDKLFDDNQNLTKHLDLSKARHPTQELKRVNIKMEDSPTGKGSKTSGSA